MIELIIGGAKSGKSDYAQQQAEQSPVDKTLYYLATATVGDSEMQQRISQHKNRRGSRWQLIEEPLNLATTLQRHNKSNNVILLDCLTLWATNGLLLNNEEQWQQLQEQFLQQLSQQNNDLFIVTNEVGLGIVPIDALSRRFVDCVGVLHQRVAAVADKVTVITAGIPQQIK